VLGTKLSKIVNSAKTALVSEAAALDAYSWHNVPQNWQTNYNNALGNLSFADGHVAYVKMCMTTNYPDTVIRMPFSFDPPERYEYRWSAN
jgi:prepilin-type processing-associated H-X9-DG protein